MHDFSVVHYSSTCSRPHLKNDIMQNSSTTEDMKTLASVLNKLTLDGYTEDFKVTEAGLAGVKSEKKFPPEEIHVLNFFRFEGASDPADNSIVYAIETSDGTKGTLTDAYGPYADPNVAKFMKQVEDITKKTEKNDTPAN
jgi:hypothetical protein